MRTAADPARPEPADLLTLWQREPPLSAAAAGRLANVTDATIRRWIAIGIPLAGGGMLRLEATRRGARVVTSRAALVRFLARLQEDAHA